MQAVYGVLDRNDCHIDISLSLKGAKRVATKDGYSKVSRRSDMYVTIVAEKINGKWRNAEC
jgi:hypothetical protein